MYGDEVHVEDEADDELYGEWGHDEQHCGAGLFDVTDGGVADTVVDC